MLWAVSFQFSIRQLAALVLVATQLMNFAEIGTPKKEKDVTAKVEYNASSGSFSG